MAVEIFTPVVRISVEAANAEADALCDKLDGGYVRIYDGPMPASVDTPADRQHLAEMRFGVPAFKPARDGEAEAFPMEPELHAPKRGKPAWYRAFKADGISPIMDGTVGRWNANMLLPVEEIVEGAEIHPTEFTYSRRAK